LAEEGRIQVIVVQVIVDSGKKNLESTRFHSFVLANAIVMYQVAKGNSCAFLQIVALWKRPHYLDNCFHSTNRRDTNPTSPPSAST
jgi:hypothetical protein